MRNVLGIAAISLFVFGSAQIAYAHGACAPIKKACAAAKKGHAIGTCVADIKAGNSVEGVTVDEADVTACKSEKGHHMGGEHQEKPSEPATPSND